MKAGETIDRYVEPPSVEMCVAMLHELDVKLDQILRELKVLKKISK